MASEKNDKTPSATATELPQALLAQAAAVAEANAEDDDDLRRSTTRDFLSAQPTDNDGHLPPPAYGNTYGDVTSQEQGMDTKASLTTDGRVNININQTNNRLSNLLVPALRSQLNLVDTTEVPPAYIPPSLGGEPGQLPPPPLNVVIHVVGSRGDVQPFVALGKVLKERYNHRVRLATHPVFRDFVTENGLEFFSIGGDPAQLMAFMVKNPGLMPGFDTLRSGDIGNRRKEIATMIKGCWRSCIESGDGTGVAADDNTTEDWMHNINASEKPFIADAIIANPPSFAHIHCAEKLGCPLHMMFTMPYSPTQAFPHPLANIQSTNADPHLTNFISYALVDMLTWQGLGDVINRFRVKSLSLDPISLMWAPGMLQRLRIPFTYCWSPALIPKPKDWGNQISISGFYFLSLASNFTPDADLKAFLDAGPPPVYIGFGSIVLDDPNGMTKLIFDAVRKTGQRALVSKGWGGFGADQLDIPESVFMLGNVPHDWLFKHVSCVVHHGGAGTTAAGIACGKPTVIVPFFGDQPFWGAMVAKAGAGPEPIPHKELNADNLAAAINKALEPDSLDRAKELADSISHEKGTESGAQSFHQFLDIDKLRCDLTPKRAAVWRLKRTDVHLSALAATTLATEGLLNSHDLKLYRGREYEADEGPPEPISGGAGALVGIISTMMMGVADFPVAALKAMRIHPDAAPNKSTSEAQETPRSPTSETGTEQTHMAPKESATSSPSGSSSPGPSTAFNFSESLAKMGSPPTPSQDERVSRSRSSSLAAHLRNQFDSHLQNRSGSRGSSMSRSATQQTTQPTAATNKPQGLDGDGIREIVEAAFGTSKGVSRIVGAGFRSPMEFTHALAKGFHNAPKLYGDESVRKPDRVTDLRSGIRAATKEFGYGMYDGITGIVTQPIAGAKKEGAAGFVKGIGKGIGGIMLKPGAAVFGIPAYTMKGIYKELQQLSGSSVQNYIIAARTAQGFDEWYRCSPDEKADIISRWKIVQTDLKRKRNPHEHLQDLLIPNRQKRGDGRTHSRNVSLNDGSQDTPPDLRHANTSGLSATPAVIVSSPPNYDDHDFSIRSSEPTEMEEAIRSSVADTSRGDPHEDAMIERAIRASISELSTRPTKTGGEDNSEVIRKAMAASITEAQQDHGEGEGHDEELEKAIKASLENQAAGKRGQKTKRAGHASDSEWDTSSSEGDADFRLALKASQDHAHSSGGQTEEQDAELQRAISRSQEEHTGRSKEEEEERVVLEYVKKQSLLEQEHRTNASKGKGKEATQSKNDDDHDDDDDDEELKRAMEMSLRKEGQEGERS